jgi:membrane protease YdiL (CAAX protease family)
MVQWRVNIICYLAAIGLPLLALILSQIIAGAPVSFEVTPELIPHFISIFFIGGPLGEEPGWRGFALPYLLERSNPIVASAILAVIWACWHLPLWFIPGAEVPRPFVLYMLGVAAITLVMTWLHLRSNGSVLLAMLFHASLNTVFVRAAQYEAPLHGVLAWWIIAAALVAVGGINIFRNRQTVAGPI